MKAGAHFVRNILQRALILVVTLLTPVLALAHGMSEEAKQRMAEGGWLTYASLGAEHMLTGYDHLLFLLGVVFFLTRFIDILKFVTAFTIGHTITLVFATYAGISANHYLIDAVIAVTVIYKGFENLDGFKRWMGVASPNLLFMVFAFGLIHGFGLSARLQEMAPAGDPSLLGNILAFNLGVEIGQVAALVVMTAAIAFVRHTRAWAVTSRVTNGGLMAAGSLLLLMQLHGYSHTDDPDAYPLSRDDHAHAHEEMSGMHSHDGGEPHSHEETVSPEHP